VYGLLGEREDLMKRLQAGEVVRGGCAIREDDDGNVISERWRSFYCKENLFKEILKKC